ncbi:MAG TPA: hypothetical protein VFD13_04770 [Candidatus Kapabacteria bacterium]|nr:hypothetical protein [Candidatus Kapabacteria bacterium]
MLNQIPRQSKSGSIGIRNYLFGTSQKSRDRGAKKQYWLLQKQRRLLV